jgi:uncharacterized lipoprotein YddW (UPF0748 family)
MASRHILPLLSLPGLLLAAAGLGGLRAKDGPATDFAPAAALEPRAPEARAPAPERTRTATPSRTREVRAVWVTRWDFRTQGDVERAIRWCAGVGLNRIFFQVRGRADALYRSSIEPWAEELGGMDPGFDPLATAIAAARAAGVELHAWINTLPGWKGGTAPRNPRHLVHARPEWFLVDRTGKRHLLEESDYTILNPCLPEVRAHILSVVEDIVTRYPVDGLHLDYIRFVGRKPGPGHDVGFDPRTLALFRKYSGGSPSDFPAEWDRFRTSAVDTVVYRIADAVKSLRPGCVVSVAAIPDYTRAVRGLFQDVARWRDRGWIDEIYPMTYEKDEGVFAYRASSALRRSAPGSVIPGIGAHLHDNAGRTVRQVDAARRLGARGYAIFAFANLFPSPSHESRSDPASKRLRAALRASILAANEEDPRETAIGVLPVANPPPGRPRRAVGGPGASP